MRHGADRSLTTWGSGVRPRQVGLDPSLVDEDEALGAQICLVLAPSRPRDGDVRPVLLGGMECPFARQPDRRQITAHRRATGDHPATNQPI
jgi:hypothetical protein